MTNILDYFPEGYTPRDTQIKVLKEIEAKWDLSDVLVLDMDTGCHRKGTEVIMYDGSLKKVEDVKVGDKLMGPDSAPRTVKKLCRGKETMYQINPVKGDSWVVNENHILSLEETPNQRRKKLTHNITVKEFLSLSKSKRRNLKLYRRGVDWENETDTTIDPYLLGVWLGDGSSGAPVFTLSSPFLVNYVVKHRDPRVNLMRL